MADDKLTQKAGDNAQQVQVDTVIINNGLTEGQVRQIYSEMSVRAKEEYTAEANQTVEKRITDFENILIQRIEKIENGFKAFADPEFQLELKKAQVTSACTDKEADYEMLSELLLHRIENKDNRRVKASISKAVEIVDKIDDDALCGLTVAYSILQFSPVSQGIHDGLEILDKLFYKLITQNLPRGSSWISYLDILDVIRFSDFASFKKLHDYYFDSLSGYTASGIKKESEEYIKALAILRNANLYKDVLLDHELLEGYVRLPVTKLNNYKDLTKTVWDAEKGGFKNAELNETEHKAFDEITKLYSKDPKLNKCLKENFAKMWNSFESLSKIQEWWDTIPKQFSITPIGKVLAHANAQRYERIPEISF